MRAKLAPTTRQGAVANPETEDPQALLKQLDAARAARERVVRNLGGESPNWWTDSPRRVRLPRVC
ncbi:MAG: hypothetical protein WCD04_21480 [Terriglobia bacterium]